MYKENMSLFSVNSSHLLSLSAFLVFIRRNYVQYELPYITFYLPQAANRLQLHKAGHLVIPEFEIKQLGGRSSFLIKTPFLYKNLYLCWNNQMLAHYLRKIPHSDA